jgi:hypothetical protein
MATPKLRDLDSYVQPNGLQCGTCLSEYRSFMEQAYEANYRVAAISRYLNDQFDAGLSVNAVRRHFREGHHEAKSKRT